MEKKNKLDSLNIMLDNIQDEQTKATIKYLFNLIEDLSKSNREKDEEIQRLRDENNRLKGEQGKPSIKPNVKTKEKVDISSEKERPIERKPHEKAKKNHQIKINRRVICELDKSTLPVDAQFTGYQRVIVQDIKIEPDNIEFKKEVYYSSSEHKIYMAKVPAGYEGQFGPTVKSMTIILKNVCNMSESKILEFFNNFDLKISTGQISNFLIKNIDDFHEEKEALIKAGIKISKYGQIDHTSTRVRGKNHQSHILCSPYYTAYYTTEKKDRLSTLEALINGNELKYCLNQEAVDLLGDLKVGKKHVNELKSMEKEEWEKEFSKKELEHVLNKYLPDLETLPNVKSRIIEAMAIAWYHKGADYPVVKILLCDDAPEFKTLTEELALCWIHEGRHYKKLQAFVPYNIQKVKEFREQFWSYYGKLLEYKKSPSPELTQSLSVQFDELFSTETGYKDLDVRIAKTKAKKENLLLVLKYPELPLHNNNAELGARAAVRKRDVSFHTMTSEGTKANDTFLTIGETCKKLGISAYQFIFQKITKILPKASLADLLFQRANNSV
jgi:hypothetical protein